MKHRPTTDEGVEEHKELVAFLGRLIGFFGGPVADQINQVDRKALEKKWLERLDESTKVVFEDARNGVLKIRLPKREAAKPRTIPVQS